MSIYAGVNVTLSRCQCHFIQVSMSLHAGVNFTSCRCRCHFMQVSMSFCAGVEQQHDAGRVDGSGADRRTHRDHQRDPRARVDGKERSGHKATWNNLREVTGLVQSTGAVDIHLGVWIRCQIWVRNPDDRSGISSPDDGSRCLMQMSDPGFGSRCRILVLDPKRIKVSGSDVT